MRPITGLLPAVFILTLFLSGNAHGQADADTGFVGFQAPKFPFKSSSVKIGALPFLVGEIPYTGEIRITYEHTIAHNQSLSLGASYDYPSLALLVASMGSGGGFSDLSWRGGRIMLGYRWYPLKDAKAPKGFYVGPLLSGNFLNIRDKHTPDIYETMDYLNASIVTGYQVIAHNGFTFDVFGGLGYRNNFISHDTGINVGVPFIPGNPGPVLRHLKLTAQVNFGYSF